MSENLDKVLLETVTKINSTSTEIYDGIKTLGLKAIDAAYVEIPEIINQLLLFKLAEAVLTCIVSIISGIAYIYFWKKLNENDVNDIMPIYVLFGGIFILLPSIVAFCAGIREILYILLAPKLYLLEYVSNLIK